MKLPGKLAGLFASGTFIVTAFPGFFQRLSPTHLAATETLSGVDLLETLLLSITGTFVAGCIGFQIGHIFSHPKAARKRIDRRASSRSSASVANSQKIMPEEHEPLSDALLPPLLPPLDDDTPAPPG